MQCAAVVIHSARAAESAIVDGAVTRGWSERRHEQAREEVTAAGEGGETLTYAQRNSRPQLAQRMLQIGIDWRRGGGRSAVRVATILEMRR